VPRSHLRKVEDKHKLDAKVDGGLYKPEFTAVELPIARDIVFSANQKERRSLYFEGQDEVYMVGG